MEGHQTTTIFDTTTTTTTPETTIDTPTPSTPAQTIDTTTMDNITMDNSIMDDTTMNTTNFMDSTLGSPASHLIDTNTTQSMPGNQTNDDPGGGGDIANYGKVDDKNSKTDKPEKKKRRKKKRPPHKSKMVTGYIIYASEIRKDIIKKYPNRDFGDISKIVGVEWKNLPQETKIAFEKRAQEQNAKSKIAAAEALELKKLADAAEEKAKEEQSKLLASSNKKTKLQKHNNSQITLPNNSTTPSFNNNNCNGYTTVYQTYDHGQFSDQQRYQYQQQHLSYDSSSSPLPNDSSMVNQQMQFNPNQSTPINQQQSFHIVQQQQQPIATTVQYCSSNYANNNSQQQQPHVPYPSESPQIQYQKNNIVYRKPGTIRLKPKDATIQTDPIVWRDPEPRKPVKFSEKFLEYLKNYNPSSKTTTITTSTTTTTTTITGNSSALDKNNHDSNQQQHQPSTSLINGTNPLSSPETNDSAYSSIH